MTSMSPRKVVKYAEVCRRCLKKCKQHKWQEVLTCPRFKEVKGDYGNQKLSQQHR